MLFVFMGPSCSGKSTAAEIVGKRTGAKIYSGKDYLRLAKAEGDAWRIFHEKLEEASKPDGEESLIFVCTEKELFDRIRVTENIFTVRFTATPEDIKRRFAERMRGTLPKPLEVMLEKQMHLWEGIEAKLLVDSSSESPEDAAERILTA
ncbi:hypothetical protein [Proteiniclasticum ruminis]|uniref:Gluconate kinase n=1 Tax=Proteiniclasticum ruminis TaxID=398199 RepID=A0A1I5B9S0_9CLOT|nr:hypothetical protein [Proteiniclasticum ruminis]SFN71436.1 Gluconate kinase [Proteiniclasticum ruminis]